MTNIDSGLSPRILMDRIYERLRMAYMRVNSAKVGDVKTDSELLLDIEAMEMYMQQLTFAYMRQLYTDSGYVNEVSELKELEKILTEIAEGKRQSITRENYIRKNAKHIAGIISDKANRVRKENEKKLYNIQQERKKIEQEKKKLGQEEKEAKKRMAA